MKRLVRLTRKAFRTSPEEWRCRAAQAWFRARNLAAPILGSAALPRDGHLKSLGLASDGLSDWWRARELQWFLGPERVRALECGAGEGVGTEIVTRADRVRGGEMPLFSLPPVPFRDADRWHRDPLSGHVAPRRAYPRLPYLSPEVVGDNKLVWEPSRFAWSHWLGWAYRVSGDHRYGDCFTELTTDWFRCNPYPIGIHYCSALEVAFRAYAWLWALAWFAPLLPAQPLLLDRLMNGIWTSCRHIESNLSHYFSPNTHLSGEAFVLFACGAAIPEWAESPRWRALGVQILEEEAKRQFHRDGTHRELSSGYHLYSTDFYLQACLIADETGFAVSPVLRDSARRFCERLAELAPDDWVLPQFNDCDGGRLLHLGEPALDTAPTLSAAGRLWPDFAAAPRPTGYALLMAPLAAPARCDRRAELRSDAPTALLDSGIHVYRNDHGDHLIFRATPFGHLDCPHSHDAALSFLLRLGGRPVVVDSGVGAYNRDLELRNVFRSAAGKNVLLLSGRGPSEPGSWFDWVRKTDAVSAESRRFTGGFECGGSHRGFSQVFRQPVSIRRHIELRDDGVVSITDSWEAPEPVTPSLRLTLAPDLVVDLEARALRGPENARFHFDCEATGTAATLSAQRAPFSPDYGRVEETDTLCVSLAPCRRGSLVTSLSRCGPIRSKPAGGAS